MHATASARDASEVLDFERSPILFATESASAHMDGGPHPHDSDDGDFDTFVEQRLRDVTSSLYTDATMWMERRLLVRALAQTSGNKSRACQILGITRGSLRHKICQLGISIHQTVSVHETNGL